MQIDYFHMCRAGFELFLAKFLAMWFAKVYQSKYILKQFTFVLVNLIVTGVFNRKGFKLIQVSIIPYVQSLLFPLCLVSLDNYMLHNFVPLILIATFHSFWLRQNFTKLKSPLFMLLTLFTLLRLFFSIPGKGLFLIILAQCVLYLFIQVKQKRHIFSHYVLFSQVVVFLVSLVLPNYNSILEFKRFHVFTRNVVFLNSVNKLFVNIFYQAVLFLIGVFVTVYLFSLEQTEKFRIVNGMGCFILFIHLFYNLLHFLFLDLDDGVSNFKVLMSYLLERNTLLFILLCLITTMVIFTLMGYKIKDYNLVKNSRPVMRKWLHLLILLTSYYAFYLKKENFLILLLALTIVTLIFIELFRINNLLHKSLSTFFENLYKCLGHDSEVEKFEISTITMLSGILIPMMLELRSEEFDWVRGGLGLFTVGVGDSVASIVGSRFKGQKYNNKSIQGMVSFFAGCLAAMSVTSLLQHGFVYNFRKMFFISIFSAIFEYVTVGEDNVAVPMFAVLLYKS